MKRAVPLLAGALIIATATPAVAADIRAVPGTNVVEVRQTFSIAVKSRVSRKVCLFTKTDGTWNKLAACENVLAGRTFKLRVRLGTAAVGRNPYLIGLAKAKSRPKPPKVRSNTFKVRVLAPTVAGV
ncbi:MAG: hypothetical protein BWY79_01644 [Actinobacteria bacterium ADurb.Bin444]|nr:MAG: hypothetical protein BWY79_01644 [Actinobacteria bacterium ADurb.Bin444]